MNIETIVLDRIYRDLKAASAECVRLENEMAAAVASSANTAMLAAQHAIAGKREEILSRAASAAIVLRNALRELDDMA